MSDSFGIDPIYALGVLDLLGIGGLTCGNDLVIHVVNKSALALFGTEAPQLQGQSLESIEGLQPLLEVLQQKQSPLVNEMTLFDQIYCRVRVRHLDSYYLMSINDITPFRQREETLNTALNMVAHDLKMPISAIKSYAELVATTGAVDARQSQFLNRIQQAVRTMTTLVNDLLDIAWIDSNMPLEAQVMNVASLVNMTVDSLHERAGSLGISLNATFSSNLPMVLGDANRLQRVFTNLITNAIKFSSPGSAIEVNVLEAHNHLTVSIEDSGIGIAPEHLPHIFDRFYRVNHERDIEGSGLGLAIVKAIVEKHRGRIEVRSEPGLGSTFMVILPAAKEESSA